MLARCGGLACGLTRGLACGLTRGLSGAQFGTLRSFHELNTTSLLTMGYPDAPPEHQLDAYWLVCVLPPGQRAGDCARAEGMGRARGDSPALFCVLTSRPPLSPAPRGVDGARLRRAGVWPRRLGHLVAPLLRQHRQLRRRALALILRLQVGGCLLRIHPASLPHAARTPCGASACGGASVTFAPRARSDARLQPATWQN